MWGTQVIVVVFMSVLALRMTTTEGALISSSRLQTCTQEDFDGRSCEQKMVVTLSVANSQADGTEVIEATVTDAVEDSGRSRALVTPLTLTLSKSTPRLLYPIYYIQRVNARPYEEVIYTSLFTCEDGSQSNSPTCGWYTDELGNVVPQSQGYCCSCSFAQLLGISHDGSRASLNCDLFGSSSASAHCLRFDELWYDVFEIQSPQIDYQINITLHSSEAEEVVSLSPTHTTSASSDGWLVGRLLGDLASFTQYEDFDNKKLTVPSQPRSNPRVQAGISNWMLVDDLRFELDGTVCNKIGVSFNAFQMESGACQNVAGSCLNNQLENLYQADLEKSQRGLVGEYLIGNYGEFSLFTSSVSNDRYLALKVEQIQNSIVTLTFPADDIVFVSTRSPGRIQEAQVESFEAGSKNGALTATVFNTGTLVADYELTVEDCTEYILPVVAQQFPMSPGDPYERTFSIYSTHELQEDNHCEVRLYDGQGLLLDHILVNFTTTATQHTNGAQAGEEPDEEGEEVGATLPFQPMECWDYCAYYNIICLMVHQCWTSVAILVGMFGGLCLVALCCCYCLFSGNFVILFQMCCCICKGIRCFMPSFSR